jgi:hypothetical protein
MKKHTKNFVALVLQLEKFLEKHNWTETRKSGHLRFFFAPSDLGLKGKFSIALPIDSSRQGAEGLLLQVVDSLKDLYGFEVTEYYDVLANESLDESPTRFTTRFIDKLTNSGAIPLVSIADYLSSMERSLYNSTKFKIGVDDSSAKIAAEKLTKSCLFLQTEFGSFVARVEVPQQVVRQADLFGLPSLLSAQVCSSFFSAVEFLNDKILTSDDDYESSASLAIAIQLFDPVLLESLSKMMVDHSMQSLEFAIETGNQKRSSSTGELTESRIERLKDYVQFIKQHFNGENDLDITGSIVELRSRDPQGNRNYILVVSEFQGDKTYVSATLNNEQYQSAVDAHRTKRTVRIKGNGMRLRTQIRITEITEFLA